MNKKGEVVALFNSIFAPNSAELIAVIEAILVKKLHDLRTHAVSYTLMWLIVRYIKSD